MRSLLLAAVVLVSACRSAPQSSDYSAFRLEQESAAAQTSIDAINIRYMRYMNGNMADSIASLFLDNAVLMPPSEPPVIGMENVRKYFAEHPTPAGANMTFSSIDVQAVGPMAVEVGGYVLSMPAAGRSPAAEITGKYVAHWRNVDGHWLQASLIWNEDAPPAPPAAVKR